MLPLLKIVVAIATLATVSAQPPGPALRITHAARAMTPGEVVLVSVRAVVPPVAVRGEWLGQAVVFFQPSPGIWQGLAPIDLSVSAGRYTLQVTASMPDGTQRAQPYAMTVARRVFPTRRITVEERFATPPEDVLPRIERERKATEAVFARPFDVPLWTAPFIRPVPGDATSSFGRRSIVNGEARSPHSGTDFQAPDGTPLESPNRGRVALVGDQYFSGRTLIIDHGAGVYSYFAHLSEIAVAEGDAVERGQVVARTGSTGRVTGPHLHWTLRIGRARVDPLSLIAILDRREPAGRD